MKLWLKVTFCQDGFGSYCVGRRFGKCLLNNYWLYPLGVVFKKERGTFNGFSKICVCVIRIPSHGQIGMTGIEFASKASDVSDRCPVMHLNYDPGRCPSWQ